MKKIIWLLSQFYRFVFPAPIFNIVGNIWWILKGIYTLEIFKAYQEMKIIKKNLTSFKEVVFQYNKFLYVFDGVQSFYKVIEKKSQSKSIFAKYPTWIPLSIVFFMKEKNDNCEGADVYARWILRSFKKNVGIKKDELDFRTVIYIPTKPFKDVLMLVHYFTIVNYLDYSYCFSNGQVSEETKDDLAFRYLHGSENYIWIKK